MKKLLGITSLVAVAASLVVLNPIEANAQAKPKPKKTEFESKVAPVIEKYCVSCHSGDTPADGKLIKSPVKEADAKANARLWKHFVKEMEQKKMPPKDSPQPTAAQRKAVIDWIKKNVK